MPAIVKDGVNCIGNNDGRAVFTCQGILPDIAFHVTTVDGSKQELVLRNEDYNIQYIEFQPIQDLKKQGIQLLFGDTFLRKYYTDFNYRDRRLSFAVRVKKKGDFVFWIVLFAVLVLVLGIIGCFYAHKEFGTVFLRSFSQNERGSGAIDPENQPPARGIVYSGQFGTITKYTNEAEQPSVPSLPVPTATVGNGYRLSSGQEMTSQKKTFFSGIFKRITAPSQAAPDVRILRERRERLLSTVNMNAV